MTVPVPISALGPITANGSTITPSSRCALGSMTAEGAMPAVPNQDCGRRAPLYSTRAIFTNSRNGWAARKTATWAGTLASNRSVNRHAPAFVEASWAAYFKLSKNVRCIGPASSSEASPLTCWPPRDGSTKCAFVNAARSASVDEAGCSKNVGCAIPPVAVRPVIEPKLRFREIRTAFSLCFDAFSSREPAPTSRENALERCPAAKFELLHPVELTLGKRHRIVEAQRTERRGPDQADADRRANDIAAVEHQSRTGSGRRRNARAVRRRSTIGIGRRGDFVGQRPGSRALIIKQTTGLAINRAPQSNFLLQQPHRHLQLIRRAPVLVAAQRIH